RWGRTSARCWRNGRAVAGRTTGRCPTPDHTQLRGDAMGMLEGKTGRVTGAGRGIGRGIAIALARAGARVLVNDLGASLSGEGEERSPADLVVDEIRRSGGEAVANYESVADFGQATAMVDQVIHEWGRIDILVNV